MGGSQISTPEERDRWERLTEKQRACLDLLLERKTSKEIARLLHISKYTVDQRITAARITLGTRDRGDTAIRYARLKRIYDRIAYDPAQLPPAPVLVPSDFSDGGLPDELALRDRGGQLAGSEGLGPPFGKIWRHDHGSTARVTIIGASLLATVIIILGGLNIAETLSRLVSD